MTTVRPLNPRLLEELELFVMAPPDNRQYFDLKPFGITIAEDAYFDPLSEASSRFFDRLVSLDQSTFGLGEMPMPRFLFFDASALPSGIIGFAKRASRLHASTRRRLQVPEGYEGLIPLSMYIAIPMIEPGAFLGHNLASMAEQLTEEGLSGLGRLTKAVTLKVLRATSQVGMTQWDSRALYVHSRLGPLDLMTAFTPAHAEPASMTYRARIDDGTLLHLAGDPAGRVERPAAEMWIESNDLAAMQALQARIEAGERFQLVGAPERVGAGRLRSPLAAVRL